MKKIYSLIICLLSAATGFSQPYASWTNTELKLSNGIVERTIQLPQDSGKFITTKYKPVQGTFDYFTANSTDFQFEFDTVTYSGKSNWRLASVEEFTDSREGNGATVNLVSTDKKVALAVQFLLYPGSPVIRKNLVIKNLTTKMVMMESIDVENFSLPAYMPPTYSWICHDYGPRRSLGPYDGTMQDALVIVHNSDSRQGIALGNEAPGVVKHTSFFWGTPTIGIGLTHKDARFPFRKYLAKGAAFHTPQVLTIVYNNHKAPEEVLNMELPDFERNFWARAFHHWSISRYLFIIPGCLSKRRSMKSSCNGAGDW